MIVLRRLALRKFCCPTLRSRCRCWTCWIVPRRRKKWTIVQGMRRMEQRKVAAAHLRPNAPSVSANVVKSATQIPAVTSFAIVVCSSGARLKRSVRCASRSFGPLSTTRKPSTSSFHPQRHQPRDLPDRDGCLPRFTTDWTLPCPNRHVLPTVQHFASSPARVSDSNSCFCTNLVTCSGSAENIPTIPFHPGKTVPSGDVISIIGDYMQDPLRTSTVDFENAAPLSTEKTLPRYTV